MLDNQYIFRTAYLNESASLLSLVEEEDINYCSKITNDGKRTASLAARGLLRKLLFDETGIIGWKIFKDESGKPYLNHANALSIPYISISHSQTMAAVALSYFLPVGIDIEDWKQRSFSHIAKYAFGAEEFEEVESEGANAFYRIWTVREALSKAKGMALLSTMDGLSVADQIKQGSQVRGNNRIIYNVLNHRHSLALVTQLSK